MVETVWLPFTQSICPTDKLRFADGVSESWISQNTNRSEHRSDHRSVSGQFSSIFYSFHLSHHEILLFGVQSSDFLVNPWVNPQIVQISLNPWIYQIYLRTFKFFQFFESHLQFKLTFILNLVIWISEAKSWDLFIKSLCSSKSDHWLFWED